MPRNDFSNELTACRGFKRYEYSCYALDEVAMHFHESELLGFAGLCWRYCPGAPTVKNFSDIDRKSHWCVFETREKHPFTVDKKVHVQIQKGCNNYWSIGELVCYPYRVYCLNAIRGLKDGVPWRTDLIRALFGSIHMFRDWRLAFSKLKKAVRWIITYPIHSSLRPQI